MLVYISLYVFVTEITTQPVNPLNVIALEDATLTCLASVDDVTYSWHHVGGNVPPRSIGQNNSTFTIPKVTPFAMECITVLLRAKGLV